jgi:hypothetical protein
MSISTVVGATTTKNTNSLTLNSIVGKVSNVTYSNSGFEITPATGFSGNISVEIKSEGSNGQSLARLSMTVLPEPVTNVAAKPTSSSISQISWLKSVNANSYAVLMDGKTICTTTANSCSISKLVGPKSVVEIIPLGGDSTVGSKVDAHYGAPAAPILVSKVSVALARNTMSAADYLSVDKVIKLVNQQGFSSVTISDISTTSKTAMGVKARLDAIVKYVKSKVADSNVRISIVAPKGKTYLNTFAVS